MPTPSPRKRRTSGSKRTVRTAAPVREAAAAAAAVDRVLKSDEAFALLIRRLEAAGWRIERSVEETLAEDAALTAPERAR